MKYWRETLAVAGRILRELGRRQRSLIFWGIFPITLLWLNGYILAERAQIAPTEAFTRAAPVTLVGAALFFSCLGGSVATVVAEREQATLKRLFISPLSGVSYFLGVFLAHSAIGLGQALLVYGLALYLGAEFSGSWLLSLVIVLLSVAAYVGVGFILGTQFARRVEDVNALVAAFGVPLLILGGAFLPAALFPPNLLDLAQWNPVFHMTEALLQVNADDAGLDQVGDHVTFLSWFALAMTGGGWLAYLRMIQQERRL